MNKKILHAAAMGFFLLLVQSVFSAEPQTSLWQDISPVSIGLQKANTNNKRLNSSRELKNFRQLSLDESLFKKQLSEKTALARSLSNPPPTIISVPLPTGVSARIALQKTSVMPPQLAEKYPQITTWKATGVDASVLTGRVDFTEYGFHAMLTLANGDTAFIERQQLESAGIYRSFSRRDNPDSFSHQFQCGFHNAQHPLIPHLNSLPSKARQASARKALSLIRYRLAVAASGEYTRFHGGSISKTLSAIVTTINRVNEIDERDLGVTLQLVPEEDQLIYTNPDTDPYTNNDANAMIEENALSLNENSVLGASRYDIGHVLTQGDPSGLAIFESACNNTLKGGGVTGSPSPQGDAFDVDFVTHELGHQLGATHTFNSTTLSCGGGNRYAPAAVEPGSGSTVMAYAGICGRNDLQSRSDAVFHAVSIDQINGYTRSRGGSACGSRVSSSNESPVADAGGDHTIPANTPFVLSALATDAEHDELSYSWEEFDTGSASDVDVDLGDNAIIRSLLPSTSAKRYIPFLQGLFNGNKMVGEILPQTERAINFVLSVRDNKRGLDFDTKKLIVHKTGAPFKVTSHQTSGTLSSGQTTNVTWDVAGTNIAPVNCSQVDIGLLTINGDAVFLKQTANDGQENVTIPTITPSMNNVRMMVKCSDNLFFNISRGSLTINGSSDTIPPIIKLKGFNPARVLQGSNYVDAGVLATDNLDNQVDVVRTGSVDTTTLGSYEITYTATDDAGNISAASRIVNVVAVPIVIPEDDSSGSGGGFIDLLLFALLLSGLLGKYRRKQA